jgi:hypothetical protein
MTVARTTHAYGKTPGRRSEDRSGDLALQRNGGGIVVLEVADPIGSGSAVCPLCHTRPTKIARSHCGHIRTRFRPESRPSLCCGEG